MNPVYTRVMQNRFSDTTKLFVLLLICQGAMIAMMVFVGNSAWFNQFFYRQMKEALTAEAQLPKRQRHSDRRNDIQDALHYGSLISKRHSDCLDVVEELMYLSPRDWQQVDDGLARLKAAVADPQASESYRQIAHQKLLRQQLRLCRFAIGEKNYIRAAELLDAVKSSLKASLPLLSYSRTELIRQYILLSKQLASSQGKQVEARRYEKDYESVLDPQLAKEWYRVNDFDGYERDYSPTYIAQWYMQKRQQSKTTDSRLASLSAAVAQCSSKSMPDSVRLPILFDAATQAQLYGNHSLSRQTFNAWCETIGTRVPNNQDEGILIARLFPGAYQERDAEKSLLLLRRFLEGCAKKMIPGFIEKPILQEFFQEVLYLRISSSVSANRPRLIKICRDAAKLCKTHGIDDTSVLEAEIVPLAMQGDFERAQSLLFMCASRAAAYDSPKTKARSLEAAANVVFACMQHDDLNATQVMVEKLLSLNYWSHDAKVDLLLKLAWTQQRLNPDKWRKTLSELETISRSPKTPADNKFGIKSYLLESMIWEQDLKTAQRLYNELAAPAARDPLRMTRMTSQQLSVFRARPSFSKEFKASALRGEFPEPIFYDALKLSLKYDGEKSQNRKDVILWLAQYEFCKGQTESAVKRCEEVLAGVDMQTSRTYLPALLLKAQCCNSRPVLPPGVLVCMQGTKGEVECLASLFQSSNHMDASVFAKSLLPRIKEE